MTQPNSNLFVNWISSIPAPQRPALARRIIERFGQISTSTSALAHQLNLASKLAFALFLEYAETKRISPGELKLLLEDPSEECLEAVVTFTIMQIGDLQGVCPEQLFGGKAKKNSRRQPDTEPMFI